MQRNGITKTSLYLIFLDNLDSTKFTRIGKIIYCFQLSVCFGIICYPLYCICFDRAMTICSVICLPCLLLPVALGVRDNHSFKTLRLACTSMTTLRRIYTCIITLCLFFLLCSYDLMFLSSMFLQKIKYLLCRPQTI